ncbi:MAG: peptidoglycan DD-metalloendopeptidase family protein [Marinibacterium sp.]|nr:peptidoglycan DD-metalloendopeptidase family protein [Marinibacterium sp.]
MGAKPLGFRYVMLVAAPVLGLSACDQPLDYDLRGNLGGFSTTDAALTATANRPKPDSRGIITYPNYQVVAARGGDTANSIAQRLGIDGTELARFNGVSPDVRLRRGEILALPRKLPGSSAGTVDIESLAGDAIAAAPATTPVESTPLTPSTPATVQPGPEPIRHKVDRGETAYTIARLYQVSVTSLAEWNGLGSDFAVREGQYLLIPIASQTPPAAASTAAATTTVPGQGSPTPTPPSATQPLPDEQVAPASKKDTSTTDVGQASKSTARMALPVQGKIVRPYSKGKNEGIDIAGSPGASVTAAADGSVAAITSDADQVPIIVVRHPDNLLTVYANVGGIKVKKGDKVKRGQKLAELRGGDDAYVHFEVREGFDSVDPSPYLE